MERETCEAPEPYELGQVACAHDLIEAQVERDPDGVAISCGDRAVTYRELDGRADRVARELRALGVRPDQLVGLCVERSPDLVVGLLGILKAGAAYLPLDPAYPEERLSFMLDDAGVTLVLAQPHLAGRAFLRDARVVRLESESEREREAAAASALSGTAAPEPLAAGALPDSTAYVIYTSGSTGRPKGVLVPHRGLCNLVRAQRALFQVRPGTRVLQFARAGFDASVSEIFVTLASGGTLVIWPEQAHIPGAELVQRLHADRVEVLTLPPSVLAALPIDPLPWLRTLVVAGEAVPAPLVETWAPGRLFLNGYGPTECTIGATFGVCRAGEGRAPIGRPIPEVSVYLLDARLSPVADGEVGEIHIGGVGVARGYLRRPGMTAERFLPDPFADRSGARMYRTGDLARRLPDGELSFVGRVDDQVKIRGFRIEPGEIARTIEAYPGVREALVVVREDAAGDRRLVAYVQRDDGGGAGGEELRAFLKRRLPEHMVPASFARVDAWPMTPNGKIDRAALPQPEAARRGHRAGAGAPRGPIEEKLAALWGEVLGLDDVGTEESFFELGGHSLLAGRLLARIREELGVQVPLSTLFEAPTVGAFAARIEQGLGRAEGDDARAASALASPPPLRPMERGGPIPISFVQEQVWFFSELAPENRAYSAQMALRLDGPLDAAVLGRALRELVRRHEIWRTTFAAGDEQPVQVIHDADAGVAAIEIPLVDLSSEPDPPAALKARIAAELSRPFDVTRLPLVRWRLFRLGAAHHELLHVEHHFVHDGWSAAVMLRELGAVYEAFLVGLPSPLPPPGVQYADVALWQRGYLQGDLLDAKLAHWKRALSGCPAALELPTDRPRPRLQSFRGGEERVVLPGSLYRALKALGQREGVTLFMTCYAAFLVLLGRYARQTDLCVGSALANREARGLEGVIGMLVNTVVLRCDVSGAPAFRALLGRARAAALSAYAHQDVPVQRVLAAIGAERDPGRVPLCQVMFGFHDSAVPPLAFGGLRGSVLELPNGSAKCDLNVIVIPRGEQLAGQGAPSDDTVAIRWEYSSDLFEPGTIRRMAAQYRAILEAVVADPGQRIDAIALLSPEERRLLVEGWSAGRSSPPPGDTLQGLFAAQVARTPDAVAARCGGETVTYRSLLGRARRLARRLRARGVGAETPVGLLADRSIAALVGVLGILEAGGTFVPLDPAYPARRLAWMLEDVGARLALVHGEVARDLGARCELLPIEDDAGAGASDAGAEIEQGAAIVASPEQAAYVLYTSGSTGTPKGVVMPHRGIVSYLRHAADGYEVSRGDGAPVCSSLAFDLTLTALLAPLLAGKTVTLVAEDPTLATLAEALSGPDEFSFLKLTPAHLDLLMPRMERGSLRLPPILVLGGEALRGEALAEVGRRAPGTRIVNEYGPTETAVGCTVHEVAGGRAEEGPIPIGRPIAGTRVYVLDERLQPAPVGVPGELYIGGDGVARGYHGRPALTAERFLPDPWSDRAGARMYRSGDLARWREGGSLEFLGRIDQQVKVRGHRIELGEIEAALRGQPGVRDAIVAVREDQTLGRCLAAYLVRDGDASESPLDLLALRTRLGETLPAPMIPALFIGVDAIPLSPNGKVDRAALAALEGARLGGDAAGAGPRTLIEEVVAGRFAEVLGLPRVGMEDDFFALGGHSLLGTRFIAALRAATLVDLPLRALFEAPTASGLAARIEEARRDRSAQILPIDRAPRTAAMPMSSAQQRLWFLQRLDPGSAAYNVPASFHLSGPLDRESLRRAFEALVERHEGLRTVFGAAHGKPFQQILAPWQFELPGIDLGPLAGADKKARIAAACVEEAKRPFDPTAAPPWRATLFVVSPTEHVLLLNVHHLVADGWSMGILFRELSALYASFAREEEPRLPPPSLQCADHAAWQQRALGGEIEARDLAYWKRQLAGLAPLELPTDRPRPRVQGSRGARVPAVLPPELAVALRTLARRHGATLFMVLMAGAQVLLSRHARQGDVAVGTPIAGRTRRELEGVVGFFANTLVLRCELGDDPTFAELLGRVREVTLDAHDHQDLPFERLVEALEPGRDLSRQPLFQVMLVLQNAGMDPPAFEGLDVVMEPLDTGTAKFDLTLSIHERRGDEAGALRGTLEYNADLFDHATAERMAAHWRTLLAAAAVDPGRRVSELPLMAAEEEQRVVGAWNRTRVEGDPGARVHHLFEAQAARTPEAPALTCGEVTLSYRELDERAGRLARRLRSLGIGPDRLVGIAMSRSIESVVGLLAVLKAGGAYVPIDPAFPRDRVVAMLRDARVALVLAPDGATDGLREAVACLGPEPPPIVPIATPAARLEERGDAPLAAAVGRDNLAYVLFTSGSTGRPKGVAMHHGALVNLIEWQARRFRHDGPARVMQYAALTFDVSFQEMFSTWRTGGAVVLSPEAVRRDPTALLAWMRAERIERAFLPPAMLRWLPRHAGRQGLPTALREVITAGELLVVDEPLADLFDRLGQCELDNHYGPTEAHVVTAFSLGRRPALGAAPIGRPIAGSRIYVLDDALRPAPIGVPGEICIGGAGVARGYVARPDTTAERFVPDPFAGEPGSRMYRTGDLARYRADGTLEFIGRRDHQVKIRGFRVELGEIEAALASHPAVAEAAVAAREDTGERRLLAYVVAAAGRAIEVGALRAHLKQVLPEYMMPAAFVVLDRMPLSSNGKLDRRALPAPDPSAPAGVEVAPKSALERRVAEIWQAVLGVAAVGRNDRFFDVGGSSLALLEVQARIEDGLGVKLSVAELFRDPTIALLADRLGRRLGDRAGVPAALATASEPRLPQAAPRARRELLDQQARRRVRARAH